MVQLSTSNYINTIVKYTKNKFQDGQYINIIIFNFSYKLQLMTIIGKITSPTAFNYCYNVNVHVSDDYLVYYTVNNNLTYCYFMHYA